MENILLIQNKKTHIDLHLQTDEIISLNIKLEDFLNRVCILYGSSLRGRIKAFEALTLAKQKSPIYINNKVIFIPTTSIKASDCILINYEKIIRFTSEAACCNILFENGVRKRVPCGYRTLKKQVKRCHDFTYKILENQRISLKSIIEDIGRQEILHE